MVDVLCRGLPAGHGAVCFHRLPANITEYTSRKLVVHGSEHPCAGTDESDRVGATLGAV